jgi:hypothetical protein
MKIPLQVGWVLALIALVLGATFANADVVSCPSYIAKDKSLSKALKYLQSIQGSYRLGDCTVELHVCESASADDAPGSLVGDLLIVDKVGRQSYLQIDFPEAQSEKRQFKVENGRIMLHYEFDDEHPDPVFGKRESVRLEFLKSKNKQFLVSLEEGWYSSKDWKSRKKGSVYNWTVCHGSADLSNFAPVNEVKSGVRP